MEGRSHNTVLLICLRKGLIAIAWGREPQGEKGVRLQVPVQAPRALHARGGRAWRARASYTATVPSASPAASRPPASAAQSSEATPAGVAARHSGAPGFFSDQSAIAPAAGGPKPCCPYPAARMSVRACARGRQLRTMACWPPRGQLPAKAMRLTRRLSQCVHV